MRAKRAPGLAAMVRHALQVRFERIEIDKQGRCGDFFLCACLGRLFVRTGFVSGSTAFDDANHRRPTQKYATIDFHKKLANEGSLPNAIDRVIIPSADKQGQQPVSGNTGALVTEHVLRDRLNGSSQALHKRRELVQCGERNMLEANSEQDAPGCGE
jgi:hypothetical protein